MDLLAKIESKEKDFLASARKAPEYLLLDTYSYIHLCNILGKDEIQYYMGLKIARLVDEGLTEIEVA
jgi:hypothetical protein